MLRWENRARVEALFKEGRTADEISNITRDRIVFVKAVVYRLAHPEEFVLTNREEKKEEKVKEKRVLAQKLTLACKRCQQSFEVAAYNRDRKYCSRSCAYVKNPDTRKMITCPNCNKSFEVYKSSKDKYCSFQCSVEQSRGKPKIRKQVTIRTEY
jgi:hypothetical protein